MIELLHYFFFVSSILLRLKIILLNLEFVFSEGDDDAITVEVVDIGPSVKVTAVSLMEAAIDSLSRELSKLRTGRASAGRHCM